MNLKIYWINIRLDFVKERNSECEDRLIVQRKIVKISIELMNYGIMLSCII